MAAPAGSSPPRTSQTTQPDFVLLRPPSPNRPNPMFSTKSASEALLSTVKLDGPPERKWYDPDPKRLEEASGHPMFRLRCVEFPKKPPKNIKPLSINPEVRVKQELEELGFVGGRRVPTDAGPQPPGTAGTSDSMEAFELETMKAQAKTAKKSRAERYFDLLMKAHDGREQAEKDIIARKEQTKKELAASRAFEAQVQAENLERGTLDETRPPSSSGSSRSSEDDSKREEVDSDLEGPLELVPFDGAIKVNIEVCIKRAPGEEETGDGTHSGSSASSSRGSSKEAGSGSKEETGSHEGSDDDEPLDIQAELAALQGFADAEEAEEDVADDMNVKKGKNYKNIWDAPDPRWALGLGGTMFFMPEVDRYSLGPSLPPPPPPSLMGRRRIRLKPRLPLDISHGRYRDEHPNIWPEGIPAATVKERLRFENKLMTLEFYQGVDKSLMQLPSPDGVPEEVRGRWNPKRSISESKLETSLAKKSWEHTQDGTGWSISRQREQVKNKKADDRRKAIELARAQQEMRKQAQAAASGSAPAPPASV